MQKDGREKKKYQMNKCINILKICKMETGVFLQETGKREIRRNEKLYTLCSGNEYSARDGHRKRWDDIQYNNGTISVHT